MDPQNKKYGVWEGLNYIEASEIKMIMILLNVVYCVADALRALGERERERASPKGRRGGTKLCKSTLPHFLEIYRTILSIRTILSTILACAPVGLLYTAPPFHEPVCW